MARSSSSSSGTLAPPISGHTSIATISRVTRRLVVTTHGHFPKTACCLHHCYAIERKKLPDIRSDVHRGAAVATSDRFLVVVL